MDYIFQILFAAVVLWVVGRLLIASHHGLRRKRNREMLQHLNKGDYNG